MTSRLLVRRLTNTDLGGDRCGFRNRSRPEPTMRQRPPRNRCSPTDHVLTLGPLRRSS